MSPVCNTRYLDRYGAFVARTQLRPAQARQLRAAGLSIVLLQIDWQGSKLGQRSIDTLRDEHDAAMFAGLDVWWWMWVEPRDKGKGRRPGGLEAMRHRLDELVFELGAPAGFVANCEVKGGWSPSRPDLAPVAEVARAAGMPLVGLSSHGIVGPRWPVAAFDLGMPQLYRAAAVTPSWARMCLESWSAAPRLWPTLGCAEESSVEEMQADLRAVTELNVTGCSWWTARFLRGAKLKAAVPGPETPEAAHA